MCTLLKTIALFSSMMGIALAADDILIADFERDTYAPWTVTGETFGSGPSFAALYRFKDLTGRQF